MVVMLLVIAIFAASIVVAVLLQRYLGSSPKAFLIYGIYLVGVVAVAITAGVMSHE